MPKLISNITNKYDRGLMYISMRRGREERRYARQHVPGDPGWVGMGQDELLRTLKDTQRDPKSTKWEAKDSKSMPEEVK